MTAPSLHRLAATESISSSSVGPHPRARVAAAARPRRTDVVLLGPGAIGRELLTQLASAKRSPLRVCAVVDTSGFVVDGDGLARERLDALVAHKRARGSVADLSGGERADGLSALERIAGHLPGRAVLVDCTAADTHDLLRAALAHGWDLVLANKVPLAGAHDSFTALKRDARRGRRTILHEATVGAGLPVIDTLRKLRESGDTVLRIEGCPSGTLGFVFGELGRGSRFSDALRRALAAGYTEPDPRIDLSGIDVARKALILARCIGFRGDLNDVGIESLLPSAFRELALATFLDRVTELDVEWDVRVAAARQRGEVLRYRATITRRRIRVGLVSIPTSNSLSALTGTDNQFSFTTTRYREQPLVITGPGAGAAVTAAGVYNDLLRVAAERRGRGARR